MKKHEPRHAIFDAKSLESIPADTLIFGASAMAVGAVGQIRRSAGGEAGHTAHGYHLRALIAWWFIIGVL